MHQFRGITLAETERENLSRRGIHGREARHQRVHIYTGGSPPCNGSARSYGRLVLWVSAVLLPWPSRAPPTREVCMSPWGSGCQCRFSSPRPRWLSPRSRRSSTSLRCVTPPCSTPSPPGSATQVMLDGKCCFPNTLNTKAFCATSFCNSITCVALPTDRVWSLREVLMFRVPPWPQ